MTLTPILIAWIVIGVVWAIGSFANKRTRRDENSAGRMVHLAGTGLAGYLLLERPGTFGFFNERFVPDLPSIAWAGVCLTWVGAAFAIWARLTLGRNWSASVTMKEDHQLVRRGPYAIVRHPIYSGALLAILGTALAIGEWRCLAAFVLALAAWKRKSLTEETFMLELFGDEYRRYRREVSALIPGLL
jgi:protein-S-isoprenylcysteine O-methyltransferase Ste14